jgi:hypothetical protein
MVMASVPGLLVDGLYREPVSTSSMLRGYDLVTLVVVVQRRRSEQGWSGARSAWWPQATQVALAMAFVDDVPTAVVGPLSDLIFALLTISTYPLGRSIRRRCPRVGR